MFNRIFSRIVSVYALVKCRATICAESNIEERLVMENVSSSYTEPLTDAEKKETFDTWGWTGLVPSYKEMEMFKKMRGFDCRYLPHYYYLPKIARTLNDYRWTKLFEHKGLLGFLAGGMIKVPAIFVRRIDGEYYDGNMNQITRVEAINICIGQPVLVLKDSVDSAGGKGFEKLHLEGMDVEVRKNVINEAICNRKRDFVVQECIKQHSSFSRFNPSSINTLRVTTLYLNGKFSVLSIILRMGRGMTSIDNWGAGGICVGVDNEGNLKDFGFDINLKNYESSCGVMFRETNLSQVPSLLKEIKAVHESQFSLCKFIGWDIAFNSENQPIVIELNSSQPGIICEQLGTGPIFGDRTAEVIAYCKSKTFQYGRRIGGY